MTKTGFIDWTEQSLNFYVLDRKSGAYTCSDISTRPLSSELDSDVISNLPAGRCTEFILSVPSEMLTLREQTFPFSDEAKISDTLAFELEGLLLGSVHDYAIDHCMIESFDISSRVLAACIEKSRLRQIIELFASSGIEPKFITCLDLRIAGSDIDSIVDATEHDDQNRAEASCAEASSPSINFRQHEFAYMGDVEKLVRKLRTTAVLVLVFFLLIAANSALKLNTLKAENHALNEEIIAAYRNVFPESKARADAGRQFKGRLNDLYKKESALGGVALLDMLRSLAQNKKSSVTFSEFNADDKNIIAKGTALTFEDVEALKNDLLGEFDNVKVTESESAPDKKINFTIVMQEKKA